ncbi:type III-A CRISPR-associated protein Csm2 [Diplocloster agilis]|uniref:CRISPR system Cms protein Csm2 n=1 Tax=Diplocloster agilis TaxID=2850323 RepID=A0A949K4L8_9FIRM|nr:MULTISPECIES: type III-A CRISPR-associated protein Csm2 [Lachnospiraceae]MBU9735433.1 type III-A CRISPR-associated protein Csm2 [Diplocloster agilis]MCU6732979.1 type III-A CRISPR-associated protein Csm2 [Suonthocola fibrivorans]SCI71269.1 CRISPR type III-A/MTUBE-associated protein Csm2 [uncultured Clostridium sp.]
MNRYQGQTGNGYQRQRSNGSKQAAILEAEEIPADYVESAERVMRGLGTEGDNGTLRFKLTTSKIRNIFSMVTDIYNVESRRREPELKQESISALQKMRVRILYDAGREKDAVKSFVEAAHLLQYIKGIGTNREKFINFANYMEALVAYHRYLGGDD